MFLSFFLTPACYSKPALPIANRSLMKSIGYVIFAFLFAVAVYSLGVSFIALSMGFAGAAFSGVFAYKFWSADKLELRKSQTRSRSLASVVNGRAKTRETGFPTLVFKVA